MGHRYQNPVLVGCQTVTEVTRALEQGADIVKLFPAGHLGPEFLKALRGPLPYAPCMPTDGVGLDAVGPWLKAGRRADQAGRPGRLCGRDRPGPPVRGSGQAGTGTSHFGLPVLR
jgi:2-dehydro-3-deoxyphosphogluconate aldolase/(4S)-4-hydroxy-2-oxoglutarate aldolase